MTPSDTARNASDTVGELPGPAREASGPARKASGATGKASAAGGKALPPVWLPWVTLALVFCLQFGGYTTLSVNFAAFVLAAVYLGPERLLQTAPWTALCAPMIYASLFPFLGEPEARQVFLTSSRELVALGVMFAAIKVRPRPGLNRTLIDRFLLIAIVVLFAYTAVQWYTIQVLRDPLFFIDWGLYGMIGGNVGEGGDIGTVVPSYLIYEMKKYGFQLWEGHTLRPVAFYSEPSYLGMMLLALLFALTCGRAWRHRFLIPIGLAFGAAALAETASGLLMMAIYLAVNFRKELVRRLPLMLLVAIPVAGYLLIEPIGRLMAGLGGDEGEISGQIRLLKPLQNIVEVFMSGYVFGVPFAFADRLLSPMDIGEAAGARPELGLDNGVLNLFIFHGVAGIGLVAVLAWVFRPIELMFILFMGMSNGALFAYDKAFLIVMAIAYVRMRERRPGRVREQRSDPVGEPQSDRERARPLVRSRGRRMPA